MIILFIEFAMGILSSIPSMTLQTEVFVCCHPRLVIDFTDDGHWDFRQVAILRILKIPTCGKNRKIVSAEVRSLNFSLLLIAIFSKIIFDFIIIFYLASFAVDMFFQTGHRFTPLILRLIFF